MLGPNDINTEDVSSAGVDTDSEEAKYVVPLVTLVVLVSLILLALLAW